MGEDTLNYFSQITGQPVSASTSATQKIHGFSIKIPSGHWAVYGTDAKKIKALANERPELKERIHPQYPATLAEVVWACQHEMALTLEDVLSRRIRLLILDSAAALSSAEKVAQLMATTLQKDEAWVQTELTNFKKIAEKYLISMH